MRGSLPPPPPSGGEGTRIVPGLMLGDPINTVTVGSGGMLSLAAASPKRPVFSETSSTEWWLGTSICYKIEISHAQSGQAVRQGRMHPHHSSSSSSSDGLRVAATAYAATVSLSAPLQLTASSRSDFASKTSPRNKLVTPRVLLFRRRRWS